ncbi:glycoside hydrolase family 16 protein [Rhizoctonia solani 123E]|uniref:Glycoside hydrolase family 16 protein n=1 Tax=Rhizoctonia solani 123E TaxID=1423351 RepID=A0A074S270_9AGAM|nr:glycoside hydrolase family 16 protein [Rhizoctonia solani 123E]
MPLHTSSKGLPPMSTTNNPPSMYSPYSPNPHSPQSSSVSLLGPQAATRRDSPGFQAAHMQAPQPGAAGAMPLGSSYTSNADMASFSSKYSLAPDPARWGARVDYGHPEADDELHNPDPKRDRSHDSGGTFCTARGLANLGCLTILLVGLICLFAGYPLVVHFTDRPMSNLGGYNLGGINASGQVPEIPGNYGLIDRDTPLEAYTHTSFEDGSEWDLVFSDEFNTDGRSFYPGDDPYWEAVDIHYWGTNNLEWYSPDMVTTHGGFLNLSLSKTPWRGLEYKGGLLTSWNKFCFTNGYFVANVSLPGRSDVYGLWPAVWTMGNLGRAGYGASVDGMWPYSYDTCDVGTLPNQTRPDGTPINATINGDPGKEGVLSYLPGQRLSSCTCAGESHPGPKRPDGTFVGRSAPEIDVIEAQVDSGTRIGHVSMSGQWAPYNYGYEWFNTSENFITHEPHLKLNTYHGGAYQQTTSVLVDTNQRCYVESGGCFSVYGFEYERGYDGYITWVSDDKPAWTLRGAGMGADPRVEIGPRPVPMEPLYMILNLGISPNFGAIDFDNLTWPTTMLVDWVRVYQPKDAHNIGCDPPDYPTAEYINTYIEAYTNANLTTWVDDYKQVIPKNRLVDNCA